MSRASLGVAGDPPIFGPIFGEYHRPTDARWRWPIGCDSTSAPASRDTHDLALRLSTAYALAAEQGCDEADRWKNVALIVMRFAREGRIPTGA